MNHYNELRSSNRKMPVCAPEGQEQAMLFKWCEAQMRVGNWPELGMLFHIPNGGKRGKAEAGRFKAEGVKPGVPDLCLPVPRGQYHGLYIEMKRREGGRVSTEQKEWGAKLSARGYCWMVCRGWEGARDVLTDYLEEKI